MSSPRAVSIGNFDGVHRGHLALIDAARCAVGREGRVIVLSFDPPPVTVLRPGTMIERLTDFRTRAELLRAAGADEVHRLEPTAHFLSFDVDAFLRWLHDEHRPDFVIEGGDFRFGAKRQGSVTDLRTRGAEFGFRAVIVDAVTVSLMNQQVVKASSSKIRWLLKQGRVADAARVLGRPYELQGDVVQGDQRGRDLGVPTANLESRDLLLPADGIYAGRAVRPDGSAFPAAISVGTKPTFGDWPRTCEAHLIGYDGPLDDYGWEIRLAFTNWMRDQIRFDGLESLAEQIHRDLQMTTALQMAGV